MAEGVGRVDLTNCDREPIHILGSIQPIGFLLALTADWIVARASANTADFIGRTPDEVIGQPLRDLFPARTVHELRNRTAMLRGPDAVERLFDCPI
ncbi:hybrid sensor histidine kinase/response regulator, partial [Bradyrhizobium sp. 14AA]